MIKRMSNDTIDFVSGLIAASIPFIGIWSANAYLHFKMGWPIEINTNPPSPWFYFINVLLVLTCVYFAVWTVFFIIQLAGVIKASLMAARQRANAYGAEKSGPNLALWGIFLAVAALIYVEGKGKLW